MRPEVLASGRYWVSEAIDKGPLGELWTGVDTWTGDPVSVRVLHHRLTRDVSRLRRVGDQLPLLRWDTGSPHLVAVLDHALRGPSGRLAFVVYSASGEPLSARLGRDGPMPMPAALEVIGAVADALSAAHANRTVHGALSPASVLMREDGFVAVIDVGLGELLVEPDRKHRRRAASRPYDRTAADVFALAVLFDGLLMSRSEVSAEQDGPFAWETEAPPEVAALMRRARSPNPELRPAMSELASALVGESPSDAPTSMPSTKSVVPRDTGMSAASSEPRPRPGWTSHRSGPARAGAWWRSRVVIVGLISAVAVAAGALMGVVLSRDDRQDAVTPSAVPEVSSAPSSTIQLVPTTVPDILGSPVDEASDRLQRAGLIVGDIAIVPGRSGIVVRSEPTQGEAAAGGTAVDLYVGNGEEE